MSQTVKTVSIQDGHLVIRIPLQEPVPSSTGKTLLVAQLGTGYLGDVIEPKTKKPVRVQVTAMVKV